MYSLFATNNYTPIVRISIYREKHYFQEQIRTFYKFFITKNIGIYNQAIVFIS